MKQKIALFRYLSPSMSDMTCVREEAMEKWTQDAIRITEYVEVEFPLRSSFEDIALQTAAIDKEIAAINTRRAGEVAQLAKRKAEVLAMAPNRELETDLALS